MAEHETLMGIAIDHRRRQIEVTTMQRGKSRHTHYPSLRLAPKEMRGEALELMRAALRDAGYTSFAELDEALTSELVVPEHKDESAKAHVKPAPEKGQGRADAPKAAPAAGKATARAAGSKKAG